VIPGAALSRESSGLNGGTMTHDVVLVLLVYHLLTSTILVPFVAQEKGRSALGGAIGALILFAPIPVLIALAAPLSLFLSPRL
jgi:hypothetical protein